MQTLKLFGAAMIAAAALDLIWMTIVAGKFYKGQLGGLLRNSHDFTPAHWVAITLIYVAIAAGVVWFVLPHATTVGQAALWGALFGLILYGLYELTNYALLTGWPISVTIIDALWGAVVCGVASAVAFWFGGVMR